MDSKIRMEIIQERDKNEPIGAKRLLVENHVCKLGEVKFAS